MHGNFVIVLHHGICKTIFLINTSENHTIAYYALMQIESLITKNIKLEKKVWQLTIEEADIVKVGSKIGESIKKMHGSKEWPPNPNDVHKDHVALPSCLETFLNTVITGSPEANFNTAKMLAIL